MPKLLCKITDSFAIEGRGVAAVLEDEWRISKEERIHNRERIRIVRPDGGWVATFIVSIEFLLRGDRTESTAFMLPKDIVVEDAPKDSMIFLEREDERPIIWSGEKTKRAEQGVDLNT